MRRYNNVFIQLLNLFVALVPNLFYPLVFGLEYHGRFIFITAAPTFLAVLASLPCDNILVKEMAANQELGLGVCAWKLLVPRLAAINLLVVAVGFAFEHELLIIQAAFVNAAALSAFFLTALYADARKSRILGFLSVYVGLALIIVAAIYVAELPVLRLVQANIALNLIMPIGALFLLRERLGKGGALQVSVARLLRFASAVSPLAMLSYGVIALAGFFVDHRTLSLLRIGASLAQASTTTFPVNQRTILERIASLSHRPGRGDDLLKYVGTALKIVALFGLCVATCVFMALQAANAGWLPEVVLSSIRSNELAIFIMLPAIGGFLIASIVEKVIIGAAPEDIGALYGLIAILLILGISLGSLVLLPNGGYVAYTASTAILILTAAAVVSRPLPDLALQIVRTLLVVFLSAAIVVTATMPLQIALAAATLLVAASIACAVRLWRSDRAALYEFISC